MPMLSGSLQIIPDSDLAFIFGGSAGSPAPNGSQPPRDWSQREKNMASFMIGGAVVGAAAGSIGGPAGVAEGALLGATGGFALHVVDSYVHGGDRSKIPTLSEIQSNRPSWADFRRMDNAN
jgi:hypothetical protein